MSNRTLVFVVAATVIILGGSAGVAFTSSARVKVDQALEQENTELWEMLARAVTAGEGWQTIAELNDKNLAEAIEAAKRAVEIGDDLAGRTPFQFAQDSTRDAQNIEFTIDGQRVYLVGPGAQAALEELR